MIDLTIIIQAGGQSKRMGQDKGLMEFGGVPLVTYIYEQVHPLGYPSFVISNQPSDYQFLGVPVFSDVIPDIGALGGIYSALYYARTDFVLMLGCDMPFIDLGLINFMMELANNSDVVIPSTHEDGSMEPFQAIYGKQCEKPILEAIGKGKRRVISFFPDVRVRKITKSEIEQFDPLLRSFNNVNTPEEYERAINMLKDL